jgi:hypothetical protein
MPLLPRKNTLDFNPDATVSASKKLKAIALERMKNPVEDPDQATLSTLDAQKGLGANIDKLLEMAGLFHNLILRIQNLLAPAGAVRRGRGRKVGGAGDRGYDPRYDDYSALYPSSSDSSTATPQPRDRVPQQISRDINTQDLLRMLAEQMSDRMRRDDYSSSAGSTITPGEFNRRLAADRGRFRHFYDDDSRNSTATPATGSSGYGIGIYPDFDDASTLPSGRSPPYYDDYDDSISELSLPNTGVGDDRNWVSLIFHLITITRRMNIVVSSNLKPITSKLSSKQIQILTKIYLMVRSSYDDITRPLGRRIEDPVSRQLTGDRMRDPFTGVQRTGNPNAFQEVGFGNVEQNLMRQNQYGDEILNTFNTARQELLLNLTVVINSWKQNTPTGQQTDLGEELDRDFQQTAARNRDLYIDLERQANDDDSGVIGAGRKPRGRPKKKDTMTMTMVGSGRNFYGEQINNSRDIPTIWRSYQNCPTKYLL